MGADACRTRRARAGRRICADRRVFGRRAGRLHAADRAGRLDHARGCGTRRLAGCDCGNARALRRRPAGRGGCDASACGSHRRHAGRSAHLFRRCVLHGRTGIRLGRDRTDARRACRKRLRRGVRIRRRGDPVERELHRHGAEPDPALRCARRPERRFRGPARTVRRYGGAADRRRRRGSGTPHAGHVPALDARYSTGYSFFLAVSPDYAVASCGKGNDYGHPHLDTLSLLYDTHTALYRTDEDGTITFRLNGTDVYVATTRKELP